MKKLSKAEKPNSKKRRLCLKCRTSFPSDNPGNRVCDPCKVENKNYSVRAESVLDL